MGIQKKYLKSKPVCKVTFTPPAACCDGATTLALVGDFNNWNAAAHPITQLKSGVYKVQLDLATGKIYQFRYLINGTHYANDEAADGYTPAGVGYADNSVLDLTGQ